MGTSTCPKCGNTSFECVEALNVQHLGPEHNFIQCAACGAVVGVLERQNIGVRLNTIECKLDALANPQNG